MRTLEEKVDPAQTAIIVVDVQNDFCAPGGYYDKGGADLSLIRPAVERMEDFLSFARSVGIMTIFVRSFYDPIYVAPAQTIRREMLGWDANPCLEGTWGADFYILKPQPGEPIVTKHRFDAFYNTNLDMLLRNKERKSVIVIGLATNICVESCVRSAYMRDYFPVLPADCTAARTQQFHDNSIETLRLHFAAVTTSGEIKKIWEKSAVKT